jgi:hypothetical protein
MDLNQDTLNPEQIENISHVSNLPLLLTNDDKRQWAHNRHPTIFCMYYDYSTP